MEAIAVEITDYELERGKPMPSENHSAVQLNLGAELKTRYRDQFRFMSELNIEVDGRVLVPDVCILPPMSLDMRNDHIVARRIPLTTIEILSPSQALDFLVEKTNTYFAAGVKSCWIVLPKLLGIMIFSAPDQYEFFHHGPDQTLTDSVTGIALPLGPIFE